MSSAVLIFSGFFSTLEFTVKDFTSTFAANFLGVSTTAYQSIDLPQQTQPPPDAPQSASSQAIAVAPELPQDIVTTGEENLDDDGMVTSTQDQVDDIPEKIDILRQQIAKLQEASEESKDIVDPPPVPEDMVDVVVDIPQKDIVDPPQMSEDIVDVAVGMSQDEPVLVAPVVYQGGGGQTNYPKILILEVQIEGDGSAKQEFVELYNPNSQDVDLTGWYLQRKTKNAEHFATFAPHTLFSGKKISAGGYFLIGRQDAGFLADIITDNPLTKDNTLALKNPNGDISDKVGWGQAQDFEIQAAPNPEVGQSIGRKMVLGEWANTDNNATDFEIDTPTPGAQNVAYAVPVETTVPTEPNQPEAPKKIVINEIQIDSIAGTGGSDDDWVELYNPNETQVSLDGWSLQKHSAFDPCSIEKSFYKKNFESGSVILAYGFFLVVDTQANDSLKAQANMTIGWSLTDNSTIYLVSNEDKIESGDDSDIVDKVGFGSACFPEAAPALALIDGKSIERKQSGQDTDNNADDFAIFDMPTPGQVPFVPVPTQDDTDDNSSDDPPISDPPDDTSIIPDNPDLPLP